MKRNITWMIVGLIILIISCKKEVETKPVDTKVVANFEYLQNKPAPNWVYFTNLSKNYYTLKWDFGDGGSGSGSFNVKHWYEKPSEYKVTLTAIASNGDSSVCTKYVKVQ